MRFFAVRFLAYYYDTPVKGSNPMGRNGNGKDTHYASVNRSEVPQAAKENIGRRWPTF